MTSKLIVPALLIAITLVAGIFAFSPVENASSVHTTIVTDLGELLCDEFEGGQGYDGFAANTCT